MVQCFHFFVFLVLVAVSPIGNAFSVTSSSCVGRGRHSRTKSSDLHATMTAESGSDPFASNKVRSASSSASANDSRKEMGRVTKTLTKAGMLAFIASMCLALPLALAPLALLHRLRIISKTRRERSSLYAAEFCARWLFYRLIPFCRVTILNNNDDDRVAPQPSVWVCNHTSMLDVFVLMASDRKLRGKHRRPLKIIYWKGLEANPITKILFKSCGFISVDMEDNGNGNPNSYDARSFKALVTSIKRAFDHGFDIGVLPEGQLNPTPEHGLQPVFSGAYTLAKMGGRRSIRLLGLHGVNRLWHPDHTLGKHITDRHVLIRSYPILESQDDHNNNMYQFQSAEEFVEAFTTVIGHFGATGEDLPEWETWLNGSAWNEKKQVMNKQTESDLTVQEQTRK